MTTLPSKARHDLAKIIALLASDQAGERDAAVLAATRLLNRHCLRWPGLLALPPPPKREPLHSKWRSTCAELAMRQGDLRPWERRFVADLPAFPCISTKQRYVLMEIAERVLGAKP